MNGRFDIAPLIARLETIDVTGLTVGDCEQNDYLTAFGQTWPAVWVIGQRMTITDDGDGWTGSPRQSARIDFALRLVVQRYAEGVVNNRAALTELHQKVCDVLFGWTPIGADEPMVHVSAQDGQPHESVLTMDAVFSTNVTYAGTT